LAVRANEFLTVGPSFNANRSEFVRVLSRFGKYRPAGELRDDEQ
jgi:hypothetical protein